MKIICVGRNYSEHAKELGNAVPEDPVLFMKPDTALLRNHAPFYLPEFSNDVHHEVEMVVRICKAGKHIQEKFAHRYYREVGIGIDFTARDVQAKQKAKGLPWEIAKAFDGSAPLSPEFVSVEEANVNNLEISLKKNGTLVQRGNTKEMLFSVDALISYISRFFTLKIGDLIYTGTPEGVGPVQIGDQLEAYLDNRMLLRVEVK